MYLCTRVEYKTTEWEEGSRKSLANDLAIVPPEGDSAARSHDCSHGKIARLPS